MENLASNISIQHLFVNSNTIFEFFDNLSCINLLCFYQNIAFNKKTKRNPFHVPIYDLDLPFYFTLSFFCCFRNANSLPGKRSPAGYFCLVKPKKSRIFGVFPKRKHCTIVSFVQCGYGCGSQI